MLQSYKVVFFDAGGTLLHPYPSVGEIYQRYAKDYGSNASAEDLEVIFRRTWRERDGIHALRSGTSEKIEKEWWKELVREVFKQAGGVQRFDAFFELLYDVFAKPDVWRLYPGTLDVLTKLKSSGKRIAIISNWDSRLFPLVKGLKIQEHVEFTIASAVFGASKPSAAIFEEALRRMKTEPSEAVHIGDSLEDDIKGALGVGMRAILIDRHHQHEVKRSHDFENVQTIHSLKELL